MMARRSQWVRFPLCRSWFHEAKTSRHVAFVSLSWLVMSDHWPASFALCARPCNVRRTALIVSSSAPVRAPYRPTAFSRPSRCRLCPCFIVPPKGFESFKEGWKGWGAPSRKTIVGAPLLRSPRLSRRQRSGLEAFGLAPRGARSCEGASRSCRLELFTMRAAFRRAVLSTVGSFTLTNRWSCVQSSVRIRAYFVAQTNPSISVRSFTVVIYQ